MTTSTEGPRDAVLAAYERQVDGLFTYCLSVLCEHEAAAAALQEVRELAMRHGARLAEPGLLRAWLYSLARYCCLRRLADGPQGGPETGTAGAAGTAGFAGTAGSAWSARGIGAVGVGREAGGDGDGGTEAARQRRELASLAWPEAAGTDPEQREALELAVRHRLSPIEVAAVLGRPFDTVRMLLASARAEVDRTRAALLVLGVGSCPELDRLGGAGAESWRDWVLGPALRRELVQHVVDCPTCRGTAERVAGEVPQGPGLSGLPVLTAPAGAVSGPDPGPGAGAGQGAGPGTGPGAAGSPVGGSGAPAGTLAFLPPAGREPTGRRAGTPVPVTEPGLRFDQGGFPRHRAPDSGRGPTVRRRVVTTGVLAAVLAAPVVALWAGHRTGGGPGAAAAVSSVRVEEHGRPAGGRRPGDAADDAGGRGPDASAVPVDGTVLGAVIGAAGGTGGVGGAPGRGTGPAVAGMELAGAGPLNAETLLPGIQGPLIPVPAHGATPLASPTLVAAPAPVGGTAVVPSGPGTSSNGAPAPSGLLTVEAGEYGSRTVLTLTNSGGTEIRWHAVVDVSWLRLSRDSGTLAPGQRITVIVSVDEDLAPATRWTARIALPPSQAVVTLEGGPQHRAGSTSAPAEPGTGEPTAVPSPTPTGGPGPSGTPAPTAAPTGTPAPTPTPTGGTTPTATPTPPTPTPTPTSTPSPTGSATPSPGPSTAAPSAPPASPSPAAH
ncbi:sigma-70 family RNA polymerase sigma factor [Kitasatospora purpeofusca]|uniref:BACON domain-containing protein n=1 Tax=Kitasatospora purpeofusca TaxID=67352 RepID=UPI0022569D7C|nr:sigma-70 family RNA polymerase sigma factor [Kitasatospora purpeofusca]MCX4686272.1 sigma-70 family RNA polymerase sigma factor [Kitasatospora purpeofusca]